MIFFGSISGAKSRGIVCEYLSKEIVWKNTVMMVEGSVNSSKLQAKTTS